MTLLLVGVSTAIIQVALSDRAAAGGVPLLAVSVCLVVALRYARRLPVDRLGAHRLAGIRLDEHTAAVIGVFALALLPIVWDVATRGLMRIGNPYEVQLAYVLRNAMLALAATPHLAGATRYAALSSFFLVVLGYLWSSGVWAIALLVGYALLGAWWLLAAYWERLGGRFADSSEPAVPVRPAVAAIVALGLCAVLLLPLVGRSPVTTALDGFFPSSGGTGANDPFAHGGVGDGDQMVAAKDNASSFGPVESELFLESKMPSLYDAFNEFSEAPPIKQKRMRRSIPLAPSQVQVNHEKRGTTQQATREFSAVRRAKRRNSKPDDVASAALLLVKGRTPRRLALETYDHWDGQRLIASSAAQPAAMHLREEKDPCGRRWLDFAIMHPTDAYTASDTTQVRVVNLKTDRVPTPAGAARLTMQGLHAGSLFSFTEDDCLAMDVKVVPQLTIFEFRSRVRERGATLRLHQSPAGEADSKITRLARSWTRGVEPGWPQAQAVLARLRKEYTHDRTALAPTETTDAVEHFLFESRRGPDYLFATSAAMLLRSLGFDTRVRSGFYVDPKRLDRRAGITPVLMEDAHFWTEVRTANGNRTTVDGTPMAGVWATLEPTPGYQMLYAPETLLAWLRRISFATLGELAARPAMVSLCVLVLAVGFVNRRRLVDGLLVGWWTIRSPTTEIGGLAKLTLRLLEWRAWAYRERRPIGTTLGRWEPLRPHDDFVTLAGWALYGSSADAPLSPATARAVCRRVIRTPIDQPTDRPLVSSHVAIAGAEESRWKP
ncbi:MAG: transglutaminase-like domain-containing protein [Planctomycetota bacterium]